MPTTPHQAWAATLALLATHQTEEIVYSIRAWADDVGGTGIAAVDRHIARVPIASPDPAPRIATVAAQAAAAGVLYAATHRSPAATRAVTTALCCGWAGAFVAHIGLSLKTRTAMPGLATSLVPGLPGAAWVLRFIWT